MHRVTQLASLILIHWTVICPMVSAIHFLRNQGQDEERHSGAMAMLVFNLCLKNPHPPRLLKTTESIFPLHNIVPRDFCSYIG